MIYILNPRAHLPRKLRSDSWTLRELAQESSPARSECSVQKRPASAGSLAPPCSSLREAKSFCEKPLDTLPQLIEATMEAKAHAKPSQGANVEEKHEPISDEQSQYDAHMDEDEEDYA